MTREEAINWLKIHKSTRAFVDSVAEAIDMAIEALSADALLKQEIDFHKEVSRIEAEKVVDLEHKLADMVSVVRCKDCRMIDKNGWCDFIKGYVHDGFCAWGERREP